MTLWGTVTTTNAPLPDILNFAAWHLEQGAHRIYLYLDRDDPQARERLKAHPKVRAIHTDDAYWAKRGGRPENHQLRQTKNACHAGNRRPEVDWLAHIDTDEFLLPSRPLTEQLGELPSDCLCARVRPVEALEGAAGSDWVFKAFHLDPAARRKAAGAVFGHWAQHLPGGFLSHVAGKLFFRPARGLQIRIHNVLLNGAQNPGQVELTDTELGHFHADSWDRFAQHYRFRLSHGSYRAGLKAQVRQDGALNLHDLFAGIEAAGGEDALRRFYTEVCTATPGLTAALEAQGLLRRHHMDFPAMVARHFG